MNPKWISLCALAVAPSLTCAAEMVTLETATTRIGFDPARHGGIVSLVDKATGREFASRNPTAPLLYELRFDSVAPLTEADATNVSLAREGQTVVITAQHSNATVECRFTADTATGLVLARIRVQNNTGHALGSVRFPALVWPRKLEHDFLVLPRNDGCLIEAPGTSGPLPACVYPGSASLQFLARYDQTSGVYVATYDQAGFLKSFGVEKRGDDLRLALLHRPAVAAGGEWRTGYDVALGTFQGDWQVAANIYKRWATQQPWCRRTLAQRVAEGDVPRWLTEPSLFYAYSLRNASGNRLPRVAEQAACWQELLGAPATMMLMAWEKQGPWVAPDYFPPFGGEHAFQAATAALHTNGHHTLVFLSGLNWTLRKQGGCDAGTLDDTAAFQQRGAASAICESNGLPRCTGKVGAGVGEYSQICAATPLGRELLLGAALASQRLGIDCVQADQIVGGGLPPCYSTRHGHPPGGGNWCAQALYQLFDEIRRTGKKHDANFAWSIEEPSEFLIPVLDTYHARDYAQGRWPRDGAGIIGVPLFTHVYHEYMHGYGGDSCGITTAPSLAALYQQAMNLVCGKTPAVAVWTRDFDPRKTDPAQLRLLRQHAELWRGPAREFLVFGERVASPPLAVPQVQHKFFVYAGQPEHKLAQPAVLHSAWKLPDGRSGTVYVCAAQDTIEFEAGGTTFKLQPGEARFVEHSTRQP